MGCETSHLKITQSCSEEGHSRASRVWEGWGLAWCAGAPFRHPPLFIGLFLEKVRKNHDPSNLTAALLLD